MTNIFLRPKIKSGFSHDKVFCETPMNSWFCKFENSLDLHIAQTKYFRNIVTHCYVSTGVTYSLLTEISSSFEK